MELTVDSHSEVGVQQAHAVSCVKLVHTVNMVEHAYAIGAAAGTVVSIHKAQGWPLAALTFTFQSFPLLDQHSI